MTTTMRRFQPRITAIIVLLCVMHFVEPTYTHASWLRGLGRFANGKETNIHGAETKQRKAQALNVSTESPSTQPSTQLSNESTIVLSEAPTEFSNISLANSSTPSPSAVVSEINSTLSSDNSSQVPSSSQNGSVSSLVPSSSQSDFSSDFPSSVYSATPSSLPSLLPTGIPTVSAAPSTNTSSFINFPTASTQSNAPSSSEIDVDATDEPPVNDISREAIVPEGPEETDEQEEAEDLDVVSTGSVSRNPIVKSPSQSSVAPGSTPSTLAPSTTAPSIAAPSTSAPSTLAPTSPVSTVAPTAVAGKSLTAPHGASVTSYEGSLWYELPTEQKAAAMTLGFDQKLWDSKTAVFADSILWDDMTSEEQMSATVLGYDQDTWDAKVREANKDIVADHSTGSGASAWTVAEDSSSSSGSSTGDSSGVNAGTNPTTDSSAEPSPTSSAAGGAATGEASGRPSYLDMDWVDLPELQRKAATELGYDEPTWNNDEAVSSRYLYWHQMTFSLREAAKTLGYRQSYWNSRVLDPTEKGPSTEFVQPDEVTQPASFYSKGGDSTSEGADSAESDGEGEGEEPDGLSSIVIDVDRGRRPQNRADVEPEIMRIQREMDTLKKELRDTRAMLKQHEQLLKVLQGLDPAATIASVQDLISMENPAASSQTRTSFWGLSKFGDGEEVEEDSKSGTEVVKVPIRRPSGLDEGDDDGIDGDDDGNDNDEDDDDENDDVPAPLRRSGGTFYDIGVPSP